MFKYTKLNMCDRVAATHLGPREVEDAHHADGHQLVDAAPQSLPAQGEHEGDLLLPGHGDHVVQSFIQPT